MIINYRNTKICYRSLETSFLDGYITDFLGKYLMEVHEDCSVTQFRMACKNGLEDWNCLVFFQSIFDEFFLSDMRNDSKIDFRDHIFVLEKFLF